MSGVENLCNLNELINKYNATRIVYRDAISRRDMLLADVNADQF